MSRDRVLTIIGIALLATSILSSIAAVHFYQLSVQEFPDDPSVDQQIGKLGMELFEFSNSTMDIDSMISLISQNSTSLQN